MNRRFFLEIRHLNKFNKCNEDFQIWVENNDYIYAKVDWYKNIQIKINRAIITGEYPMKPPDIQHLEVILINKL